MRNPIPTWGPAGRKHNRGGIIVRDDLGVFRGLPALRSVPDEELAATLIGLGMPAMHARIDHPSKRWLALKVWADVISAGKGDPMAAERVDFIRSEYQRMRRELIIADRVLPDDYSVI